MVISQIIGIDRDSLKYRLEAAIAVSRFTAEVERLGRASSTFSPSLNSGLSIQSVRLRERKEYCGNHPGACQGSGHDAHRKSLFLEGADWVEFNDMVNDVLDRGPIFATVFSKPLELTEPLFIRLGFNRRINYGMQTRGSGVGNRIWQSLGNVRTDYAVVNSGESEPSSFPDGTPGRYEKIGYFNVG